MLLSVRRLIGRVAQLGPFYRLAPPGPARIYGELRYNYARKNWSAVLDVAKTDLRRTTERFSNGMLAAHAGFYAAEDDFAETIIRRLLDRFPAEPQPFEVRAKIRKFQGRYDDALADAERARLLVPSSWKAVAQVIRCSYLSRPPDVADRIALDELRRHPRSAALYWVAATGCRDAEQFKQILQLWQESHEPASIVQMVYPLARAAARAGEIDTACDLYRQAIRMAAKGGAPDFMERRSEPLGAQNVLTDINEVMGAAKTPYFFARRTALGLVRDGRLTSSDSDVYVGAFDSDWNRSTLERTFQADSRFAPAEQDVKVSEIAFTHRLGVDVNILRFYPDDSKIWHDSTTGRHWNTPFRIETHRFGSRTFPLPSEVAGYLRENYGDWMSTAPTLDPVTMEAPNLEVTRPEYDRLQRLERAHTRICTGDRAESIRELVNANEPELANDIEVDRG